MRSLYHMNVGNVLHSCQNFGMISLSFYSKEDTCHYEEDIIGGRAEK